MKYYKDYKKKCIGSSDVAMLIVNMCGKVYSLYFGEDGNYKAYIVDSECEIPEHYSLELEGYNWLKIYDDFGLTLGMKYNHFKIYRAGNFGCIIQLLEK